MLSIALIAIDATILATAVPAIVRDLGGFTQFPWLFSAYLLTQAISTPIYGKLADTFGRKPLMLFGIGTFVLGSVLCARVVEHGRADRVPCAPRARRRRDPAGRHDDHGRHLLGGRAGRRPGVHRQRVGDVRGRRADARRPLLRPPLLAVDLLDQPAARPAGRGRAVDPVRREPGARTTAGRSTGGARCWSPAHRRCCCSACSRAASGGRGGPGRAPSSLGGAAAPDPPLRAGRGPGRGSRPPRLAVPPPGPQRRDRGAASWPAS